MNIGQKCSCCGEVLTIENIKKKKSSRTGYAGQCIDCLRFKRKQYNLANKHEIKLKRCTKKIKEK